MSQEKPHFNKETTPPSNEDFTDEELVGPLDGTPVEEEPFSEEKLAKDIMSRLAAKDSNN
jgi:hypothetical protein